MACTLGLPMGAVAAAGSLTERSVKSRIGSSTLTGRSLYLGKSERITSGRQYRGLVQVRAEGDDRQEEREAASTSTATWPTASSSGSSSGRPGSVSGGTQPAPHDEADDMADGVSFGQLCDEFECISSPSVERTARQLARDIYELRESKRQLGVFGVSVKYKDPLRSFQGRDKFKRLQYFSVALEKPTVHLLEMSMQSPSNLRIRWCVRGHPAQPPASLVPGDVALTVTSTFDLNQISGQVIEAREEWDLGPTPPPALAYFWSSRLAFSVAQAGRDAVEAISGVMEGLGRGDDSDSGSTIYPDPSGDPRKFFQVEGNPNQDLYQIGFFIALIYLIVEVVKFIV